MCDSLLLRAERGLAVDGPAGVRKGAVHLALELDLQAPLFGTDAAVLVDTPAHGYGSNHAHQNHSLEIVHPLFRSGVKSL